MVTTKQLQAYYQRVHGITPGTPYDPYLHENVPALAFGPLPDDIRDIKGVHLRPEKDLARSTLAKAEATDKTSTRPYERPGDNGRWYVW